MTRRAQAHAGKAISRTPRTCATASGFGGATQCPAGSRCGWDAPAPEVGASAAGVDRTPSNRGGSREDPGALQLDELRRARRELGEYRRETAAEPEARLPPLRLDRTHGKNPARD